MEVPRVVRPPPPAAGAPRSWCCSATGPHGPDLLYIQRNEGLRRHAGQPAFPGGKIEDGDDGPVGAALREAAEETGLDPAGVDVLATLPELFIRRSEFRVVAGARLVARRRARCGRPTSARSRRCERISVADLVDPANRLMLRYPGGRSGPAFRIGPMLIWGFTALLTDRLLALGGLERPWDATRSASCPRGPPDRIPCTPCAVICLTSSWSSCRRVRGLRLPAGLHRRRR